MRDSIPVHYTDEEPEKLNIKTSLKISNDFTGNYELNQWYDYRNLTMIEYGFEVGKLPILLNFGVENGSIYNQNYRNFVHNIKLDFQKLIARYQDKVNLSIPVDQLDPKLSEEILKNEIKKRIKQEINSRWSESKLDSLQQKLESIHEYEKIITNPQEIEKIKERKTILREYVLGNKIEGLNYDSLSKIQSKFDKQVSEYNENIHNKELIKYRGQYDELMENKEKLLDVKNRAEEKIQSLKNNFRFIDKLSLSRLKINKLNLGQTSIDNSPLVFKQFSVNGVHIEISAPFYFQGVYSLPFQTNLFSNFQVNNGQNNQISTLGGCIGTSRKKKWNLHLGYYQFEEKKGNFNLRERDTSLKNRVANFAVKYNSKTLNTELDIAKSETSKYPKQSLFSLQNLMPSAAIKWTNELTLQKTNTDIKLELQSVGLGFYSSANPFVQRGIGGLISIQQRIGTKFNIKTKFSYRQSEDSNRFNSNLTTNAQGQYKLNKNSSFILRGNYFKSRIEFNQYYTSIENEIYSIQWNQKLKHKQTQHLFIFNAQYMKNKSEGSPELNNTGISRIITKGVNYSFVHPTWNIQANMANDYHIDSSIIINTSGVNFGYSISKKTLLGGGLQVKINNIGFVHKGLNINFQTEITKFSIIGTLHLIEERLLSRKIISPQVRLSYKIF